MDLANVEQEAPKNVLHEWHAYIRTMVQFPVLEQIFHLSGHFTCLELSF